MKTAIQELIDYLEKYEGMPTVRMLAKCRDLIETEKQQIIDAYNMASKVKYSKAAIMLGIDAQPYSFNNGSDYYNLTFCENEKTK